MYPYFGEYILKILPALISVTEKLNKNSIRKRRRKRRRRGRREGIISSSVYIFFIYQ